MALLSGHFSLKLSALLLFDLLHRLEEELLDVASLVEDHLADLLQVAALLVLLPDALVQVSQLFMLLTHDLLVLELEQLSLFLKVGDNLTETLLKQVDLRFEQLDLLGFFKLALSMLLHGHALLLQLASRLVIVQFKLSIFIIEVGQLFVLKFGFLTQSEVLNHDVPLNL